MLIGKPASLDAEAADLYESIWPKHEHYAKLNKALIKASLTRMYANS